MHNLLCRFRVFKEKCRHNLIHKLGGFSIMPPSKDHVIVRSTTVAPTEFACKALFTQDDIYDITPEDLKKAAKEKLRSKLIFRITESDMVDFTATQDEDTGSIEMCARIWLIDPKAMKAAKGD